MAALDGSPDLALGNALGSNIVNTGLVLGVTALVAPIVVSSKIVRRELPLLLVVGLVVGVILWSGALNRFDALLLLACFFILISWSIFAALRGRGDALETEIEQELVAHAMPIGRAIVWLVVGLVLLIVSSRILVWGAVSIAQTLGVSDIIIGLTIVALGTSLPELAASMIAARKGEHDIAIGNVVGSNMFNLLAVVGIAGVIAPMPALSPDIMTRDWPVMMSMTVGLFVMAYGISGKGLISRVEGAILLLAYVVYNIWLVLSVIWG
jgi:cation:H+ antiporter